MERTLSEWKEMLIRFATEYDDKQSKKRGWNSFALYHYLKGINGAIADPEFLQNPKKALAKEFIVSGETGGINHRNLPADYDDVKFSLSFLNRKGLWQ